MFLFYAVWSSWINGTCYHDLHGTDDLSIRVFTFAQMFAVALMAVHAADVPGEGATGLRHRICGERLLARVALVPHRGTRPRPPLRLSALLHRLPDSASLFAVSVWVEPPLTYWLWAMALLSEGIGYLLL